MSVVSFAMSPGSDPDPAAHTEAGDARQRMLAVKKTLDEASAAIESLQGALAAQHDLEQLLKQGRAHLQDLRSRLQHVEAERDRLTADLADSRATHQREIEALRRQVDEQTNAQKQFADEREAERSNFTRLVNEAAGRERDLLEERERHRQRIEALRETGLRAQSLAREIVRVHETSE